MFKAKKTELVAQKAAAEEAARKAAEEAAAKAKAEAEAKAQAEAKAEMEAASQNSDTVASEVATNSEVENQASSSSEEQSQTPAQSETTASSEVENQASSSSEEQSQAPVQSETAASSEEAVQTPVQSETASAAPAQTQTTVSAQTSTTVDTTNTYPVGQCTWGVKSMASWVGNYWGNARDWIASAQAAGHSVGTTPAVGAVAVWPNDGGGYGHVAYVTSVDSSTSIQVMESNYAGNMSIGNYRGSFNPTDSTWGGGSVYYIYQ